MWSIFKLHLIALDEKCSEGYVKDVEEDQSGDFSGLGLNKVKVNKKQN